MHFSTLIDQLLDSGIAKREDLVGVPLAEIQAMEEHLSVRFPISYIQFLHACGRSAGKLSDWSAIYFDDLKEIIEEFEFQKIANQSDYALPSKAFFIGQYESRFDFMICDGSADPKVFRVDLDRQPREPRLLAESYSQYFLGLISTATEKRGSIEPFYIDECGEWQKDDLMSAAPAVE